MLDRAKAEINLRDFLEFLSGLMEKETKINGKFPPITMKYLKAEKFTYNAFFSVNDSGDDSRYIKVFVQEEGSDLSLTHFYKRMTTREMKEYILSDKAVEDILSSTEVLMEKMKDRD